MDYEEAQDYRPTRDEIDREIRKHGADPEEFYADMTQRWLETHRLYTSQRAFTGQDVLGWLGY